jgi:hypothetical protein
MLRCLFLLKTIADRARRMISGGPFRVRPARGFDERLRRCRLIPDTSSGGCRGVPNTGGVALF